MADVVLIPVINLQVIIHFRHLLIGDDTVHFFQHTLQLWIFFQRVFPHNGTTVVILKKAFVICQGYRVGHRQLPIGGIGS